MIERPIITLGSPIGIGYEILLLVKEESDKLKNTTLFCVGSKNVFEYFSKLLNIQLKLLIIESNQIFDDTNLEFYNNYDIVLFNIDHKNYNINDIKCLDKFLDGGIALDSIDFAINLVENKLFKSLVTLPVSKENINLIDKSFKGHTEYIQKKWKQKHVFMTFISEKLNILLLTTHISLKKASRSISKNILRNGIYYCELLRKKLNDSRPICLLGLNPHAGENGLLGKEENYYKKIVLESKRQNIAIEGPIPSDTAFIQSNINKYSIFIANYHDQGLIPFKMLSFDSGVNLSFGMKYIRTSVDHGTAVDLIGKKIASFTSFENAYRLASIL